MSETSRQPQADQTTLIEQAFEYFEALGLGAPSQPGVQDQFDPNIQDSDGLVSYIVSTTNPPPPELEELYNEIAPVMEGLTNVVVSAVLKQAGTDDSKKHDPKVWREPMQAMVKAFCSAFKETEQHQHQRIRGVEVAGQFLKILIEAIVSQGTAVFADFVRFLQSQGETMRLQASTGGDGYLFASVAIAHEIFQGADGRFIYVPKFKSYFTQFNQETFKLTSACASYDDFNFDFHLQVMTGAFMVESWKSSEEFRNKVREFIEKFQKANIEDSENYFDGVFNSEPDPSGNV